MRNLVSKFATGSMIVAASLFVAWLPSTRLSLDRLMFGRALEPEGP